MKIILYTTILAVFIPIAFADEKINILDFHVHQITPDEKELLKNKFGFNLNIIKPIESKKYKREGQFLISSSYNSDLFFNNDPCNNDEQHSHSFTSKLNEAVSREAMSSDIETIGICGIDLREDDYLLNAENCLNLKKMKGIKLHFYVKNEYLIDPQGKQSETFRKFEKLLQLVNKKKGYLLIHFNTNKNVPRTEVGMGVANASYEELMIGNNEEVTALLEITKDNPNAKIIIAHSGLGQTIGLDGIKQIGMYYKTHPNVTPNIYIETSAILASLAGATPRVRPRSWPPNEEYYKELWKARTDVTNSWKAFGVERVLFGSDFPGDTLDNAIDLLNSNEDLTDAERNSILYQNGEVFF